MRIPILGGMVASWALFSTAWGVAPNPKLVERLKEEGKWEEFAAQYKSWGNYDQPNAHPYHFTISPGNVVAGAVQDTLKAVVIYAYPSDRPPSSDGLNVTRAQLQAILFGANATGNITDYYREISYGQTVVTGTVFGPFALPHTNAYYTFGSYGIPATNFALDALAAADPTVDFSQFDANGDGVVDALFFVHSGPGAEETGRTSDIWSHATSIAPQQRDGKWLSDFSIEPEQQSGPIPIQIGVFCHEAGHALFGLPDLYDLDGSSEGAGVWCLMSSGNYNNGSQTPTHMSAWCNKQVGWITPVNLGANQNNVSLPAAEFTPTFYRLWTNGTGGGEYFLLENRPRKGFDSYNPAGGLLIWHIDEAAGSNDNENRYMVGLMQADGQRNLNLGQNRGDAGDPYPGSSNNRNFDEFSNPNSKKNVPNTATQVAVFNISNADSVMTANMEISYGRPRVTAYSTSVDDALGNGNGLPEAGETVNLYYSFTNAWLGTANWNVKVRSSDTLLSFTDSTALIANLAGLGATTSTAPDPITFSVSPNFGRSKLDSFFVYAWNFDSSYSYQAVYLQPIGPTQLLLVDDDHGRTIENYYKLSFDSVLIPTRSWNVKTKGAPPAESLALYPSLIWFTANDSSSLLNAPRIAALQSYMNAGGNVVLSGQGIAQSLWSGPDSTFLRNYFHCRFNAAQAPTIYAEGVPGHPLSGGVRLVLVAGDGANNQTQVDNLAFVDGRADKLFTYATSPGNLSGPLAAVAYADSVHRSVFCGFGLEAINSSAPGLGGAKRSVAFSKILDWLESSAPTGLAVPYITLDQASLSFSATSNGSLPAPESLLIENTGGGTLSWTAALNPAVSWLAFAPDSGTAASVLSFSITSSNLLPGTYTDTAVITSAGAYNNPQKVSVSFTVNPSRGDLSGDGLLTSADIVLLLNCVYLDTGNCLLSAADINCDGILTAADVVKLLNVVFLGAPLPC